MTNIWQMANGKYTPCKATCYEKGFLAKWNASCFDFTKKSNKGGNK